MKRLILMAAAALLMMTQCRKSEVSPVTPGSDTIKITVTAGPGRTDITAGGAITWSKGDKLWVSDGVNWLGSLNLESGAGGTTGLFTGKVTKPAGMTDGEVTLNFFYLGGDNGAAPSGTEGDAVISFARQNVYADGDGRLVGAGAFHVGMGDAKVTLTGSEISGLNVILQSMVAIARMEFEREGQPYCGPLDITGDGIWSKMSVSPDGTCAGGEDEDTDNHTISLGFGPSERYVFLVPVDDAAVTMTFNGDQKSQIAKVGETTLGNGIKPNMLYQVGDQPITVSVNADQEWVTASDIKWSKYNLGATLHDPYGDWYAWGAVEPWYNRDAGGDMVWKSGYSGGYAWANAPFNCGASSYDAIYFTEVKDEVCPGGVLSRDYDVARVMSGGLWRMPTSGEFRASFDKYPASSTKEVTNPWVINFTYFGSTETYCGIECSKNTALFLPAAGLCSGKSINNEGYGFYWSSSLYTDTPSNALYIYFLANFVNPQSNRNRYNGFNIRTVRVAR